MRWILCSFLAVFLASPAAATTVDFTTAFWHGANPVLVFPPVSVMSFTETNVAGSGVDVTASTVSGDTTLGGPSLTADTVVLNPVDPNGLGMAIGLDSSEIDELEVLRVAFSQAVMIDSILVSRLFREDSISGKGDIADEQVQYTLEGGAPFIHTATNVDHSEGQELIAVGSGPVNFLDFTAPPGFGHDYNIISINFTVVPEPTVPLLLGCLGLALAGRRRSLA